MKEAFRKILIALAPILVAVLACGLLASLFSEKTFEGAPTATLAAGWILYEDEDFELQLPRSYAAVSDVDSVPELRERHAGTELEGSLLFYASKPSALEGLALVEIQVFSELNDISPRASASIVGERTAEELAATGFDLIDQGVFEMSGDAYYLLFNYYPEGGDPLSGIQYIFQFEGKYWSLLIVCNPDVMRSERCQFDQIAQTFRPGPE